MTIRKFKDWSGWWDGMRSKMVQSGAKSLTTSLSMLMGTNAAASLGIPGLQDLGMNWKQAILGTVIQFALHSFYAGAKYAAEKPDPDVLTKDFPTEHITNKDQ